MKPTPNNEGIRGDLRVAIGAIMLLAFCLAPGAAWAATEPHSQIFATNQFPSATLCKQCHAAIYAEWSISSHAYASISPVFHKFDQKINELAQGTVGTF